MTARICLTSAASAAAFAAETFFPVCAFSSFRYALRAAHALASSPAARYAFACRALSARLVPGPTPVESAISSVSCAPAPRTRTWNVFVDVFPEVSVAVHDTVVVPIANVPPEAGRQLTVAAPARSAAVTVKLTAAPAGLVASTTMSAGTVRSGGVVSTTVISDVQLGGVVSTTVTVKLAEAPLADESVASHVTVVVPSGNTEPEPGEHVTATVPSVSSVADAV